MVQAEGLMRVGALGFLSGAGASADLQNVIAAMQREEAPQYTARFHSPAVA